MELPENAEWIITGNKDGTYNLIAPVMTYDIESLFDDSSNFVADNLSEILSHKSMKEIAKWLTALDAF